MITLLIISSIIAFYAFPAVCLLYNNEVSSDYVFDGKRLIFVPILNIFILIFLLILYFVDFIVKIKDSIVEKIEEYKEKKKLIRERKDKIKKGIIRITPIDPYGEETYDDDDCGNEENHKPTQIGNPHTDFQTWLYYNVPYYNVNYRNIPPPADNNF